MSSQSRRFRRRSGEDNHVDQVGVLALAISSSDVRRSQQLAQWTDPPWDQATRLLECYICDERASLTALTTELHALKVRRALALRHEVINRCIAERNPTLRRTKNTENFLQTNGVCPQ